MLYYICKQQKTLVTIMEVMVMKTYYIYCGKKGEGCLLHKGTYYNEKSAKYNAGKFLMEYDHVHLSSFDGETVRWTDIIYV